MPKYDPLTHRAAKFLLPLVDRFDWGLYEYETGSPKSRLTNEQFAFALSYGQSNRFRLTRTQIEHHLKRKGTFYYRCNYNCRYAMICLDIDTHEGEGDAEEVAHFIAEELHSRVYYEPSTNEEGRHVYLMIDRKTSEDSSISLMELRDLIEGYTAAVNTILARKKFEARIDRACGTHTLVSFQPSRFGGKATARIEYRGTLAKLPRFPFGNKSIDALQNCRAITVPDLLSVIRRGKPRIGSTTVLDTFTSPPPAERASSHISRNLEEMREESDAFKRSHYACTLFRRVNGRFPHDEGELEDYYVSLGLHTGPATGTARSRRLRNVLAYQQKHQSNSAYCGGYQRDKYMELVRKHVEPEHRVGAKLDKGRKLDEEDLAIGLYLMEQNAMSVSCRRDRQGSSGVEAIVGMFRCLKMAGETTSGCNYNKATAIRVVLANSGLICVEDETWKVGGEWKGVCKKYGLGEAHPRRAEYLKFVEGLETKNGQPPAEACEVLPAREDRILLVEEEECQDILGLPFPLSREEGDTTPPCEPAVPSIYEWEEIAAVPAEDG